MLDLYKNIKKRRSELKMSQDTLAQKTGYSDRSSIAKIESGNIDLSYDKILLFAKALDIEPSELMGDTETMFVQPDTFSLDEFVKQHNGTELEIDIMKTYFSLPADIRKMMIEHFKEHLNVSKKDVPEQTVEEAEAEYIKKLSSSAQRKDYTASNTTNAADDDVNVLNG